MPIVLDNIIRFSGWFIALGFVTLEIIRYFRNRYKVYVNVSLELSYKRAKEKVVVIEVSNEGRRPINLTFGGLYFETEGILYSDELNIEVGWVYKKLPSYSFIKPKLLKELVKSIQKESEVEVIGVAFLNESGSKHIGIFPDNLRKYLGN